MNGQRNCILAICCPPGSESRVNALAEEMAASSLPRNEGEILEVDEAGVVTSPSRAGTFKDLARWIIANFDLAPKGSLVGLYGEVASLAREGYAEAEDEQ